MRPFHRLSGAAVIVLSFTGLLRAADAATQPSRPTADQQFVKDIAADGLLVVRSGMVASARADLPEVRKLANTLIDAQATTNTELKQLASRRGVDMPTELDADAQRELQDLSQRYGRPFDRAYILAFLRARTEILAKLQKQAAEGQDPELRSFAQRTIVSVQQQVEQARDAGAKAGLKFDEQQSTALR